METGPHHDQIGERERERHVRVLIGYAVGTALVLWPAVRYFTTRPFIGSGDSSIFYWAWWWVPRALGEGASPFETSDIMFPVGVDLRTTVLAPGVSVLTWPVRAVFGPEAQVNAAQLLAVFTAATATYFVAHRLCRHQVAAALAGASFALTTQRFVHIEQHLNLIATGILPLAILLFLRYIDEPTAWRASAVGASIGFAALLDPQLWLMCLVGVLPFAIHHRRELRAHAGHALPAAFAAIALALPVMGPLVAALREGASSAPPSTDQLASTSASPLSWIVPPPWNPWVGGLHDFDVFTTSSEGLVYPGLGLIVLAVIGRRVVAVEARRGWVALAWVGVVLSLGPFLVVGSRYVHVPLPYLALRELPFMDTMRAPGRFGLIGALAICVLAASALAGLARRVDRRRLLLASVLAITLVELWPRAIDGREGGAPAPYHAIAADPGEGAVLEIPMQWSTGVDVIGDTSNGLHVALFMAWATVHGKPYVGGSVSRYPDDRLEALYDIDLYRQILAAQDEPGFDDPLTFTGDELAASGIGYVVYHRDAPEPLLYEHLDELSLPVLADDGTIVVWRVPGT